MKKRLFQILFALSLVVFAGSAAVLTVYYGEQKKSGREYQELMGKVVFVKPGNDSSPLDDQTQSQEKSEENTVQAGELKNPPVLFVDFEQLKEINQDIVAWIDFPGQNISYPVVQGSDNEHYLKYTFEGLRNASGCIFVDSRNSGLLTDDNTIIYGHNMRNGSMFGMLKRYMEQEYYELFPYFDIYTPDTVYRCEIVVCCRVLAKGENYPVKFSESTEKTEFIQNMENQSSYNIEISDRKESGEKGDIGHASDVSPLIMLSTCVGGQSRYRFVMLARAVKVIR